ncbi:MAG TPA: hypothetical protein ENI62_06140 [Gammaproteobacteria bacterium]|nr:hypothetical protein [Gammaproteobacteria bacterium]
MRYSLGFVARSLFLFLAALSPINISLAAVDKFDPYAYAQVLYDTNVFRVSDNEKSETIKSLGVGLNSDLKLSRQHLLLDVTVDRVNYNSLDELDHTKIDGRGTWAWQVGNLWNGDLGYSYKKELSSFTQRLTTEKDMRTAQTGFWKAGYKIHPDWKIIGALEYEESSYQERDFLDRDKSSGALEVQYSNTRNTRVGIRVSYSKNELSSTNLASGVSVSNDYDTAEYSGVFYWEISEKSSLEASLGYTDLKYDDLGELDFQGSTGRLTYLGTLTGKTKVEIAVWRETSSLYDEIISYVLQKGVRIRPTWSVTPKISITGEAVYTNDDFKGRNNIASALGGQRRDDDLWLYRVGAAWGPRSYLQVAVNYQREERESSIGALDYDDDQIDITVQFDF